MKNNLHYVQNGLVLVKSPEKAKHLVFRLPPGQFVVWNVVVEKQD